jgi:ABC-type glycerol-3-phosphate transport system substrate-binding protein
MKKNMNRRDFLRLAGSAAAGAALAACQPQTVVVEKEVEKEVTRIVTEKEVVVATPEPSERITVDFMNWWAAERQGYMDENIAQFEEEHPGIHVVNALQPWDRRAERAATAIASRNPPAVIMTRREETLKFAHEELIIPFDDYIEASGLDLDAIFYEADVNNQRWDGKVWSLPLPGDGGATSIYLYNKDMLRDAGFDPDKPPETWQEMEDLCRAVTVIEGGAIKTLGTTLQGAYGFPVWLYCNNGEYCTQDAKELTFNSSEGVEALGWMVNFENEMNGGVENVTDFLAGVSGNSADFPFYNDGHAIYFTGTWAFGHFETQNPEMWADTDRWGVGLRPYNGNNSQATHHGVSGLQWAWGYSIPANLPREVQDAAYKWVEWWITQESVDKGGCQFLFKQTQVSAVKNCSEDPAWHDENPYWGVVVEALGTDVSIPITPAQSEVGSFLDEAVEEALYGQKTPQEALDWAAEKGQAVLDRFWSEA